MRGQKVSSLERRCFDQGGLLSFPRTGCAPYADRKHTGKENMHASVHEVAPLFARSYRPEGGDLH